LSLGSSGSLNQLYLADRQAENYARFGGGRIQLAITALGLYAEMYTKTHCGGLGVTNVALDWTRCEHPVRR